jgi:glycosyltransferase involved in cell wall biosynthesis
MNISVVMATYNGERYLKEQIDSILSQTLSPQEFIVCDDCSTDGTVAILEQYQRKQLLTYVVNERQLGLIGNFKKAVSLAAENNCVALSDQDDIWLPDKLLSSAAVLEHMDNNFPCLVHTDLTLVDVQNRVLNDSFKDELAQTGYRHNLETLLFANFVTGCTMLMNTELRHAFPDMPDDIKFHDAWIALFASVFGSIDEIYIPMVRYRKHGNNLSIAENTKRRNRYRSTMNELLKAFKGQDDFLSLQFETARRFYNQYHSLMVPDRQRYFEKFLKLEGKPYIIKKLAYRKVVKQFKL